MKTMKKSDYLTPSISVFTLNVQMPLATSDPAQGNGVNDRTPGGDNSGGEGMESRYSDWDDDEE